MRCPSCNASQTKVNSTRKSLKDSTIRRYRQCSSCKTNFTTDEAVSLPKGTLRPLKGIDVEKLNYYHSYLGNILKDL